MNTEKESSSEIIPRRNIGLDLIGLSDDELKENSVLLGGSSKEYVRLSDEFDFNQIDMVLFEWGDSRAAMVFAQLLEHDDRSDIEKYYYFPFSASTIISDEIWTLAVQNRHFDPEPLLSAGNAMELPFNKDEAPELLAQYLKEPVAGRREILGRVGQRWVAFELGMRVSGS
ncbi:MAG: hypothetical protein ACM3KH_00105 [Thiobacillus sp.]